MKKSPALFFTCALILAISAQKNTYALEAVSLYSSLGGKILSSVKATPWGILVGEDNPTPLTSAYNGLYMSFDAGASWLETGLQNRRVTDIDFSDGGNFYAATSGTPDGQSGLFTSEDRGITWSHIGPNTPATKVKVSGDIIYLGTYGQGLWVSRDEGLTWEQKIGNGTTSPPINNISVNSSGAIVFNAYWAFRSLDNGNTWTDIPALNGKKVKEIRVENGTYFALMPAENRIWTSKDIGISWTNINTMSNCLPLSFWTHRYYLYLLCDDGTGSTTIASYNMINKLWSVNSTWVDCDHNYISSSDNIRTPNEYIYVYAGSDGFCALELFQYAPQTNKFLGMPWQDATQADLTGRISSYFDHSYPLLGYNYFMEPDYESSTTTNYMGDKRAEPFLYYSTHDGIDFALPIGTQVNAAADGIASYYYCTDCGNTIKVDHQNGYESIYMHLQNRGLVTTKTPVMVTKGTQIGLVGLTGNTNGPHLHFAVQADTDDDGKFSDNYPENKIDPFGWLNTDSADPWEIYSWKDALGQHQGTGSAYLWDLNPIEQNFYLTFTPAESSKTVRVGNISLKIFSDSVAGKQLNISLKGIGVPHTTEAQQNLKSVVNSAFEITAYDNLDNEIKALESSAEITVDLKDSLPLLGFGNIESLKIYVLNEITKIWEPLHTTLDLIDKTISAQAPHFSEFAVFVENSDITPSESTISVSGKQSTGAMGIPVFKEFPVIELHSDDTESGVDKIVYSIDDKMTWEQYIEPFDLKLNGIYNLWFKGIDNAGNMEIAKSVELKIDPFDMFKQEVYLTGGQIKTAESW